MMNISVVMTTYNGAHKLLPQLVSLRDQTRKADEVLIFDDCSDDQTVEIIQNFIYENHLYDWTLIENERNKGKLKNYADALNTARGGLLFLCEQDGQWNPDRIETMAKIMEEREDIQVLASSYEVRSENKTGRIRRKNIKAYGDERVAQVKPEGGSFEPLRPGFTCVLRKEMVPLFRKVWEQPDTYDRVIWQISLLKNGLFILNEKNMVQIRFKAEEYEHSSRAEQIAESLHMAEKIRERLDITENVQWLDEFIRVLKQRENAMRNCDLKGLYELKGNRAYMPSDTAWLGDIAYAVRSKLKKDVL